MTSPALAARTAAVLRHPALLGLAFDLNGLCVTGLRYTVAARALEDGRIRCEVGVPQGRALAPGNRVEAVYEPDRDTMRFPREDYGAAPAEGAERSTMLHEATHALFDLFAGGEQRVLAVDDEVAAVLAQAFYIRMANEESAIRRFAMISSGPGPAALSLADSILDQTEGFRRRQIYVVRPEQASPLRAGVQREWNLGVERGPDGEIVRDRRGTQVIYNGVACRSCAPQGGVPPRP